MLISMERGSSKRRDKGLQLIPAPVERKRVNCSHVGFSIQEYTLSQNEFFIRVQCGKWQQCFFCQPFNSMLGLQSPLVDTLGVTCQMQHPKSRS